MVEFKYFKVEDFACQETGENLIESHFVHKLDRLREVCGFSFIVTSGYRSPRHSKEAAKAKPGQHSTGRCADIAVHNGRERMLLVREALLAGFTGIGVARSFVHIDERLGTPVMWVYG